MPAKFRLIMLSAMYENGGNTTQRLLDGHPELFSYPFESQLGTQVRRRPPHQHVPGQVPLAGLSRSPRRPRRTTRRSSTRNARSGSRRRSRASSATTRSAWTTGRARPLPGAHEGHGARRGRTSSRRSSEPRPRPGRTARRSGHESVHVGYSPIVVVDADKIVADFPEAHVLHVVRNPWSAYADTKKRAVPLSMAHYMHGLVPEPAGGAHLLRDVPGARAHLRFEDIMADPVGRSRRVPATRSASRRPATLARPTWNGRTLQQVYPWGTIRTPTLEANRATAEELSAPGEGGDLSADPAVPRDLRLRCVPVQRAEGGVSIPGAFDPVLVTGAAGFVGLAAIRAPLRRGHEVHAVLRPGSDPWRLIGLGGPLARYRVDLADVGSGRGARPCRTAPGRCPPGGPWRRRAPVQLQGDGRRVAGGPGALAGDLPMTCGEAWSRWRPG